IEQKSGRTKQDGIYQLRSPKQTKEILLEEKRKVRAIRRKAGRYAVTNGILYKRSFLGPWLRCFGPLQADYVLREIHEGSCSMHAGPRSMVSKALRSGEIISDNEKPFRDNPFKDWCEKLCIHQCFASIKHPQANGLVERSNKSLGEGIKARLDERSKNWMEEISHFLWAHHTMIKSSNGETPFSLTYGTEATFWKRMRDQAAIQEAKSKDMMEKYYNARVCNIRFKPRDLVYRTNEASNAEEGGKLRPKWEGLYEVTKALGKGAYKLRDYNRSILPRTWNVFNLKKCYVHEV
nr:hypothetical protein [Tanacetum cinerariifolium]